MSDDIYGPALLPEEYATNPPPSTAPVANNGRKAIRGPSGLDMEAEVARLRADGDTAMLAKLAQVGLL